MERKRIYFASDVHLGLQLADPVAREARFVSFLQGIPKQDTAALYLLGDIWDFWYEYRDVVPKGSVRVLSAIMDLLDAGVEVYFCPGNHDIWCYSYFEELGMKKISQPHFFEADGKVFCVGHGDGLGPGLFWYRVMNGIFRNRVAQALFSALHPWFAFRIGCGWSRGHRTSRATKYVFKGAGDPLYEYCLEVAAQRRVDYFIFGHIHSSVDMTLPAGERLVILDSWLEGDDYWYWDGSLLFLGHSMKME